jgi:sugar transferase EpsL
MRPLTLFLKRLIDITFALAGLLLLWPVMAAIALLIRLKTQDRATFTQERAGLHGQIFHIYKFRTMTNARNDAGELLPDEERLFPLGRLLRKFSLDELPQLFNVLKGDLSLVGPRPLLVRYLPRYTAEQARRHDVPPGITGWAQVNGRNAIGWEERFRLDVWYVDHWSLWLDFKILVLTIRKVLQRSDVSHAGHATMPEFMGTQGSLE